MIEEKFIKTKSLQAPLITASPKPRTFTSKGGVYSAGDVGEARFQDSADIDGEALESLNTGKPRTFSPRKLISIFPYNVKPYYQNAIFDIKRNKGIEATIFATLKEYLKEKNLNINTYDISTEQKPFIYVFFDLPYFWNFSAWKKILFNRTKKILVIYEPPTVNPFNYMKVFHLFFAKVYTWYGELVDNERSSFVSRKYFKINLPKAGIGIKTHAKKFKEKKFLALINKNILPFFPFMLLKPFGKELYTERIKSIEFFEHSIPNDFYLYGRGWNKPKKYNLTEKFLGFKKYSTYRGEVEDKIELLSKFKFCLCFENLTDVKGYVTEKIFDCLKARCVPIYWGASDIEKYIPKDCFIDFRDFGDYEKLLHFLVSMDESRYNSYIKNIESLFLDKEFIDRWFEMGFAKFFLRDILEINDK